MLVEGIRPLRELLVSESPVLAILVSPEAAEIPEVEQILDTARDRAELVATVLPDILQSAADTDSPQGILAIAGMPDWSDFAPVERDPLILIADRVRDPGNLGTLIRSAHGAGCNAILVSRESADPFSPKVIRSSAGSVFHLPVVRFNWSNPPSWLDGVDVYITEAETEATYDDIDWTRPAAIVIGNETEGVSKAAFAHADGTVGIPLANSLESLNAGIAGSVILFEAWRQRRRQ
ncbi:MAG: RNA methyltransferase [Sphaerobacteraceae bacterium]|nr:MAG: RNA methyltransferase [Sphaerobacteraceae bacterium]